MKVIIFLSLFFILTGCAATKQDIAPQTNVISTSQTNSYKSPASMRFPVTLASGQRYSPSASINSSCADRRTELRNIKRAMGGDLSRFMRRGPGEQRIGLLFVQLSESLIDDKC